MGQQQQLRKCDEIWIENFTPKKRKEKRKQRCVSFFVHLAVQFGACLQQCAARPAHAVLVSISPRCGLQQLVCTQFARKNPASAQ